MITRYRDIGHIKGWFGWYDYKLFQTILKSQEESAPGALVELGAYLGKSAVVIGDAVRDGEDFVVLDLFGESPDPADAANANELTTHYRTLNQQEFEKNYLSLHDRLPTVVQGLSSEIMGHVEPGSVRFCHVDASHLYEHVLEDAANAQKMMRPGGVVVFDDFRSRHTPGVAAVVWNLVATQTFIPVAVTSQKMYGVFSDPERARAAVAQFIRENDLRSEEQQIAGHPVVRIAGSAKKKSPAAAKPSAQPAEAGLAEMTASIQKQLTAQHEQTLAALEKLVSSRIEANLAPTVDKAIGDALQGTEGKKFAARVANRVATRIEATSELGRLRRRARELRGQAERLWRD